MTTSQTNIESGPAGCEQGSALGAPSAASWTQHKGLTRRHGATNVRTNPLSSRGMYDARGCGREAGCACQDCSKPMTYCRTATAQDTFIPDSSARHDSEAARACNMKTIHSHYEELTTRQKKTEQAGLSTLSSPPPTKPKTMLTGSHQRPVLRRTVAPTTTHHPSMGPQGQGASQQPPPQLLPGGYPEAAGGTTGLAASRI